VQGKRELSLAGRRWRLAARVEEEGSLRVLGKRELSLVGKRWRLLGRVEEEGSLRALGKRELSLVERRWRRADPMVAELPRGMVRVPEDGQAVGGKTEWDKTA
jgi:hypothetical protein